MEIFLQDYKQVLADAGGAFKAMSGISYLQDKKTNAKNSLIGYLKAILMPAITRAMLETTKVYYLVLTDFSLVYLVYDDGDLYTKLDFQLDKIENLSIGTANSMTQLRFDYAGQQKVYHLHRAVFFPDGSYSNSPEDIRTMGELQEKLLDNLKQLNIVA